MCRTSKGEVGCLDIREVEEAGEERADVENCRLRADGRDGIGWDEMTYDAHFRI
jgi:hypothetical protein